MSQATYTYTVPAIPPSLNVFAGRGNVYEYRKLKQQWKTLVKLSCRKAPPEPLSHASVTLTYFFPDNKRRDLDNLPKFVLDGIVDAGVIKDDCWQCITLCVAGAIDRDNPRTEITITEMQPCSSQKNK